MYISDGQIIGFGLGVLLVGVAEWIFWAVVDLRDIFKSVGAARRRH